MGIDVSYPPPLVEQVRYRAEGHWLPARTVGEHLADIEAGGAQAALIDQQSMWTYNELAAVITVLGGRLQRHNVDAGDPVLLIASLHNAAAAAYLAVHLHGAVAILLDRRCGTVDAANALQSSSARVALAFRSDAERLNLAQSCEVILLDDLQPTRQDVGWRSAAADRLLNPDKATAVVFTSGTTSAPKGVIHTPNSLRASTNNMMTALRLLQEDRFLLTGPLASITGVLQIHAAMSCHASIVLQERFTPTGALEMLSRYHVTVIGGAPIIAQTLFDEANRQGVDLDPLRRIALGGSAIAPQLLDTAAQYGVDIIRVYGSSEVPFSTATAPHSISPSYDGTPLPGVNVGLRNPEGAAELLISGPHQFQGYLDCAHNEGAFAGSWVRTGDKAELINGGVRIIGRLKEIAIRKGMKISLAEIDSAAVALGECAAYAVPDPDTGERLVLAIHTAADITFDEVTNHLRRAGLATWKLPEQIVLWDQPLPRTASGKVIRSQLSRQGTGRPTLNAARLR